MNFILLNKKNNPILGSKPLTALEVLVPLIMITASSAIRSSTTSSAVPRNDGSKVSSPSISANVETYIKQSQIKIKADNP